MPVKEPPPRPFLKWAGGKRQLLPELLEAVASAGPFEHYHEPFLGGGALFFALARAGRIRAGARLSDVNQNLIETYLGVRDEAPAVIALLKDHERRHSEDYFYRIRERALRGLARRAARVIYLNRTCFNGLYRENSKGQFNTPFGRYKNPRICDEENLLAVSRALQQVHLGVQDFTAVLDDAKSGDLIYFDPPYDPVSKTAGFTAYSRGGFGADAQKRLAEVFATLAAGGVKVILSNSMTDFTRDLYAGFPFHEVMATRRVNSRADRRGKIAEALVTNFPIHRNPETLAGPSVIAKTAPAAHKPNGAVRRWLLDNAYDDVATLIDEVTQEWKAQGKRTGRNWWEILAGDSKGNPRGVCGRLFPVLRAAQLRQGVPVTSNALCRNDNEVTPAMRSRRRRREH